MDTPLTINVNDPPPRGQLPEGLADQMLASLRELREWLAGPVAPDAQVRAWRLFSSVDFGGVYCVEPGCGCECENSQLIAGGWPDGPGGDLPDDTFTLDDLDDAIAAHIAHRAALRAEDASDDE